MSLWFTQEPSLIARAGGPVPEFVPLVAWALVGDDTPDEPDRIVGMVVVAGNRHPEAILADDPSFLGYAGPGDLGIDRVGFAPDWRTQAKQAIGELNQGNERAELSACLRQSAEGTEGLAAIRRVSPQT